MKTKDIIVGTQVYATVEHRESDISNANTPGVVLSTTPWRTRHTGRGEYRLEPDPEGTGFGQKGYSYTGYTRGLLTLVPVRSYHGKGPTADEAAAELVSVAAGVDIPVGLSPVAPEGYRFALLRPQAIVDTWAEKTAYEAREREARKQAAAARNAEKDRQSAAYDALVAVLGSPRALPYTGPNPDYVRLLEFAEAFHQGKLAQLGEAISELESLRDEDLREEDAAHDVYGTHS